MKSVAVVYGGYSSESVISARSARMVLNNIDAKRYRATAVRIDKGGWNAEVDGKSYPIDKNDFSYSINGQKQRFDSVFMMIHGTPGEDGILQGYFELLGIPHTTGDVLNMSLTFNKEATKAFLSRHGFVTAESVLLYKDEVYSASGIIQKLGLPCFVKPNRGGSSFGASKVNHIEELQMAVEKAFQEDAQVIIESFVQGTEVTCGVILHHGFPRALPVTEIVSEGDFFDYAAKYEGKSQEITPARLDHAVYETVQRLSENVYHLLNCRGMIRVDYLIKEGVPYIVEVNTVPGFSEQSIIPQQAGVEGISKTELISLVLRSAGVGD